LAFSIAPVPSLFERSPQILASKNPLAIESIIA
jgi:hypothetical protein